MTVKQINERNHSIFNTSPDCMIIADFYGLIVDVNPSACSTYGYTYSEFIGMHASKLIRPDFHHKLEDLFKCLKTSNNYHGETIDVRKNGGNFYTSKCGRIIQFNNKHQVLVNVLDISEQKNAEIKEKEYSKQLKVSLSEQSLQLNRSNELFYNIVEKMEAGILIVDRAGIIKFLNKASAFLFKREVSDLLGQEFGLPVVMHEKIELDIWRGDKTTGIGELTSIETEWEGELAYLIFINDISHLKKIEDNLKQISIELNERNKDLESYAHTVAHDLKGPLANMAGFADLICEIESVTPDLSKDKILSYAKHIMGSSEKLLNIIDELLLFASLQKTDIDIQELNMEEIVSEAIDRSIPDPGQTLINITLPDNWLVSYGYAPWVEEVWKNYITNAMKYGGTPLKIEFGSDYDSSETHPGFIKYWIKDSGPGISDENQKLLFEKFERLKQAKATGYGLGLSIVRRIIDKLGGTTGVESELGKGSTFYFTLPAVNLTGNIVSKSIDKATKKNSSVLKLKTLIVEDDMASYVFMDTVSKKFSADVMHVSTGSEAVKACHENPDIDLILMDVSLPDMSGLNATKKIREFNKDVVIIAQTALTLTNDRQKAIEAGCNDYISKPLYVEELYGMIKNHLPKKLNKNFDFK